MQDQFALTAYDDGGLPLSVKAFEADSRVDMKTPPSIQVEALAGTDFFAAAAELPKLHPPHLIDWPFIQRLARIGLVAGKSYDVSAQPDVVQVAINAAPAKAKAQMIWKFPRTVAPVNQWSINIESIGTYGTSYFKRPVVARFGLGSNVPEDSVYPLAFKDADGNTFDGRNNYVLHFEASQIPPVAVYWSLSLYDNDGFPVPNKLNRYAVSSWMPLIYNADGSLDIYIQTDSPGADKEANWLPALTAGFGLNMHLYAPLSDVIAGKWAPPAIRKVGG